LKNLKKHFEMKNSILLLFSIFLFFSCNNLEEKSLPAIKGKAYELTIVIEKTDWKNSPGDSIISIFAKEIDNLPQPEPEFSITQIPPNAFTSVFKHHRNILNIKIGNSGKTGVFYTKDVWAKPQQYVTIKAKNYKEFSELVSKHKEELFDFFENAETQRTKDTYSTFIDKKLVTRIKKNHQISLTIPKGYKIDMDTTDFIWLSLETEKYIQGIFIYSYNYTDTNTFTKDYLIKKRNEFLLKYVPSSTAGSYMTTETLAPISFQNYKQNNTYSTTIKGLWKVEKNFMGGPFISVSKLDEKTNRIITVEGFVYFPNNKKRNLIKQLEVICNSLNFD